MKILALIALYKRPEVVEFCVQELRKLDVTPLFILSPDDPHYSKLKKIISDFHYIEFPNYPLGLKMNMGVAASLQMEYDYFMNMGSDDVIEPRILDEMKPYFNNGDKLIGYNSCFVVNFKTKEKFYLENVCKEYPIGAGRMIHRSIIDDMVTMQRYNLYEDDIMAGLDGNSSKRIKFATGIEPKIIFTKNPPVTDYKTNTNINPIPQIWRHLQKI